ncbi:MAG: phytanoyl-CoA dioxygenase family protein [Pseudomonadota bacterium]
MFSNAEKNTLRRDGFCVFPNVLDASRTSDVRAKLLTAAAESRRRGVPTYIENLDPNDANVRVFNLLDLDPVFLDLIAHPLAIDIVRWLLEDDFIISNFTANVAGPGSESMVVHSDLAVVLPEPWHAPWSMNIIWCLDDVRAENGATLYLPGSHDFERRRDLPAQPLDAMVPFEAAAGSIIAMDGRLWHTSGVNKTQDEERALLFGYYSRSFIRPQWNFNVGLSQANQARLGPELARWLGLGLTANVKPLTGL